MSYKRNIFKSANRFQNRLMWLIFFTLSLPLACIALILAFIALKSELFESQAQAMSYVSVFVLAVVPISVTLIWVFSYMVTNKTVGSLHRVMDEIDQRLKGGKKGAIAYREGDYTSDLIKKINELIERSDLK